MSVQVFKLGNKHIAIIAYPRLNFLAHCSQIVAARVALTSATTLPYSRLWFTSFYGYILSSSCSSSTSTSPHEFRLSENLQLFTYFSTNYFDSSKTYQDSTTMSVYAKCIKNTLFAL